MLKFKEALDRQLFFAEVGRLDLIGLDTIQNEAELNELQYEFLKRRRSLVSKIKDFRKSQQAKQTWNRHRFSIVRGMKNWHKSTDGKRFHRQLGRFLATRLSENYEKLDVERYETLKALSSLRTHMYIEGEYFRPSVDEDADFDVLVEYAMPLLNTLEYKLLEYKYDEISYDELEVTLRLVDESEVIAELSAIINDDVTKVTEKLASFEVNEDLTYGITVKYYKLLERNSQIDHLKSKMEIQDV